MIDFSPSEEQKALVETARRFTKERIIPVAAEADREARFPMQVFKDAWEIGLVNTCCSAEYGGPGMGELENAMLTEELAYGCTGIQTSITANVLALTPIKLAGTEEQKKKYFGLLTSEPLMASYATSEPDAGSDVAGLKTRFDKHGDDYVLNGRSAGSPTPATPASTSSSPPRTRRSATRASPPSSSTATRRPQGRQEGGQDGPAPATPPRSSSRT